MTTMLIPAIPANFAKAAVREIIFSEGEQKTRFDLVVDTGKGMGAIKGGGSGFLGEQRLISILLQAVNNIHRYFLKVPLILPPEALSIVKRMTLDADRRRLLARRTFMQQSVRNGEEKLEVRKEFEQILERLHSAIAAHTQKKNWRQVKIDLGIGVINFGEKQ